MRFQCGCVLDSMRLRYIDFLTRTGFPVDPSDGVVKDVEANYTLAMYEKCFIEVAEPENVLSDDQKWQVCLSALGK